MVNAEAWDVIERLWDEMPDTPGVPRDGDARPSLDAVLDRAAIVCPPCVRS
ncbi:MAG: hypothetical protein ACR2HA_13530 [Nocardioides sp.]